MGPKLLKGIAAKFQDARGFLLNVPLQDIFDQVGQPEFRVRHQLITQSDKIGTFRGFHYQEPPFEQAKLVLLEQGEILDLVLPIEAPDMSQAQHFEMAAGDLLYVPKTFAHGFVTRSDTVRLHYIMDQVFSAPHYAGRNGVAYAQTLTDRSLIVSEKDAELPPFGARES